MLLPKIKPQINRLVSPSSQEGNVECHSRPGNFDYVNSNRNVARNVKNIDVIVPQEDYTNLILKRSDTISTTFASSINLSSINSLRSEQSIQLYSEPTDVENVRQDFPEPNKSPKRPQTCERCQELLKKYGGIGNLIKWLESRGVSVSSYQHVDIVVISEKMFPVIYPTHKQSFKKSNHTGFFF